MPKEKIDPIEKLTKRIDLQESRVDDLAKMVSILTKLLKGALK